LIKTLQILILSLFIRRLWRHNRPWRGQYNGKMAFRLPPKVSGSFNNISIFSPLFKPVLYGCVHRFLSRRKSTGKTAKNVSKAIDF